MDYYKHDRVEIGDFIKVIFIFIPIASGCLFAFLSVPFILTHPLVILPKVAVWFIVYYLVKKLFKIRFYTYLMVSAWLFTVIGLFYLL